MGMNIGGGGKKHGVKGEINITPLIDVVLVLLIIFMVLVPASLEQLTAAVPRKVESAAPPDQAAAGAQDRGPGSAGPQRRAGAPRRAGAAAQRAGCSPPAGKVVFFDVADGARYGAVVRVMDLVKGAGGALAIVTRD